MRSRWIAATPGFLFPVRALAQVFRAKVLDASTAPSPPRTLTCAGALAPPSPSPAHVLDYLGRYTHRVALSTDRLLSFAEGVVRFRCSPRPLRVRVRPLTRLAGTKH